MKKGIIIEEQDSIKLGKDSDIQRIIMEIMKRMFGK